VPIQLAQCWFPGLDILNNFCYLIVSAAYIPYGFRLSYTVPIPKDEQIHKGNSVDNYRAISVSPIISKIFEHCILSRYSKFLVTSSNQFGFRKGSGCDHAIYSVRKVVEHLFLFCLVKSYFYSVFATILW